MRRQFLLIMAFFVACSAKMDRLAIGGQTPTVTPTAGAKTPGPPFSLPFVPAGYEIVVVGGITALVIAVVLIYYFKRVRRKASRSKSSYTVEVIKGTDTPLVIFRIPMAKREAISLQTYQVDNRRLLLRFSKQRVLKELVFPVEMKRESIRCYHKEDSLVVEGEPARLDLIPLEFRK